MSLSIFYNQACTGVFFPCSRNRESLNWGWLIKEQRSHLKKCLSNQTEQIHTSEKNIIFVIFFLAHFLGFIGGGRKKVDVTCYILPFQIVPCTFIVGGFSDLVQTIP